MRSVRSLIQASYIKKIEDVMAALTETQSVEVSVTLYVFHFHFWSPRVLTLPWRKYPGPECDSEPEEESSDEDIYG